MIKICINRIFQLKLEKLVEPVARRPISLHLFYEMLLVIDKENVVTSIRGLG